MAEEQEDQEEQKTGGFGINVPDANWCYTTGEGVIWMLAETVPGSEWTILSLDPEDAKTEPPLYSWDFNDAETAQLVFIINMYVLDGLLTEEQASGLFEFDDEGQFVKNEKMKAVLKNSTRIT